jgi:hypothetical protein
MNESAIASRDRQRSFARLAEAPFLLSGAAGENMHWSMDERLEHCRCLRVGVARRFRLSAHNRQRLPPHLKSRDINDVHITAASPC